jgi:hypothetical protein
MRYNKVEYVSKFKMLSRICLGVVKLGDKFVTNKGALCAK